MDRWTHTGKTISGEAQFVGFRPFSMDREVLNCSWKVVIANTESGPEFWLVDCADGISQLASYYDYTTRYVPELLILSMDIMWERELERH